jgi:hypothetical protein
MNINLNVSGTAEVQKALAGLKRPQARKAVVLWENWLGIESQGAMRREMPNRFSFRGTRSQFEKAIVFQQAKASGSGALQAVLKVGGSGAETATSKFGRKLARHEEEGQRTQSDEVYYDGRGRAFRAGFYIPAKGMRTATSNPARRLYPSSVGAAMRVMGKGENARLGLAKGTRKGSRGRGTGESFFATPKGIFRRKHTSFGGRVDVELLWFFRSRIRTPARLRLWETAEKVFETRAVALGLQAVEETLFRASL